MAGVATVSAPRELERVYQRGRTSASMFSMDKRMTLRVRGRVQGVFYRASARDQAVRLGLRGGVRNRLDGSVELWAEGDEGALDSLLRWCHQGPPAARV